MKRKMLSLLLTVCMVLSMLPFSAHTVETDVTIHDHRGDMADFVIRDVSRESTDSTDFPLPEKAEDFDRVEATTDDSQCIIRDELTTAPIEKSDDNGKYVQQKAQAAKAATGYKIYINGTQLTSAKTSVSGDSGTASYNAGTNTLTLNNFTLNKLTDSVNRAGIWCDTDVNIELIGTNTINLSGLSGGGMTGIVLMGKTTIKKAASASGTPSLVIKASAGTGNFGIGSGDQVTAGTYSLTIQDVNVEISDNASNKGTMYAIDFAQTLKMTNVGFKATNCQYGIYASTSSATATLSNVNFNVTCFSTANVNSGLSFLTGTYTMENCSGSIQAYYPIEAEGNLTMTGCNLTLTATGSDSNTAGISAFGAGTLTISGGKQTIVSAKGFGITADDTAKFILKDSAQVDITAATSGLYVKNNAASVTASTLTIKAAEAGIQTVSTNSSFTLNSGSVTVTGTDSSAKGIENTGTVYLKGGTFTTNSVQSGIYNDGTKNVEISGGTQNLNVTYGGYASYAANKLIISGGANFKVTGGTYGLYSSTTGSTITIKDSSTKVTANSTTGVAVTGSLSITGGTTSLTFSGYGVITAASSANISLTGGTVDMNYTGTSSPAYGIYNEGALTIGGSANVTVTGAGTAARVYGLAALDGTYSLSGGALNLKNCSIGLYVGKDLTISGMNLTTTNTDYYGIFLYEAALTLSSGKITASNDYVAFYFDEGSSVDFAGATVNASAGVALYFPTLDENKTPATYKISGGSLTLYGGTCAGNKIYNSLASGYVVHAGSSESDAALVSSPNVYTFANNKYVRIFKEAKYTLTLENVQGSTSASYSAGGKFTYTAQDAPAEKHFKQWELSVGGATAVIGTEKTITYTMPASDATLTAVYEYCDGGTPTCQQKAVCSTCGEPHGLLAMHNFKGKVQTSAYLCSGGNCQSKATYYYSCIWCGLSSKGTPYEGTFEGTHGTHDFTRQNPSGDYLCTEADCENAATYYYCCSVCGASSKGTASENTFSYGSAGGHSYTRQNPTSDYLCTEADCAHQATYYYCCSGCGASSKGTASEKTFPYGTIAGSHDFSKQNPSADYLCTEADCTHRATYYYSCATCGTSSKGTVSEKTFSYGSQGEHSYTKKNPTADYLCTKANSEQAATYYYCCEVCGASSKGTAGEATFSYGSPIKHDLVISSTETIYEGTDYTYEGGILTIKTDKMVTIKNADGVNVTTDRIVVAKDVDAQITLAGVNIDQSATGGYDDVQGLYPGYPALLIADDSEGNVDIILAEGTQNVLKGGGLVPGLCKNGMNGGLSIYGSGTLIAEGGFWGAGIGSSYALDGSNFYHVANIFIQGGNITAIGSFASAGIGGGGGGSAFNINISGGNITAIGGFGAAGIGGGGGGSLNGLTVMGGKITAIGGTAAAGIGGGLNGKGNGGSAFNININGGNITAISGVGAEGEGGAGIGSAMGGTAKNIVISGGVVLAYGEGSGIGGGAVFSGKGGSAEDIKIFGGVVTASSEWTEEFYQLLFDTITGNGTLTEAQFREVFSEYKVQAGTGAGIGSAMGGTVKNIVISGGSVNAIGGTQSEAGKNSAQAIGNGFGWTEEFTPTNAKGEKVYALAISNPNEETVYIDGVWRAKSNHKAIGNDTNLYLWLTGEKHMVKVGTTETLYHFISQTKTFLATDCVDNDHDHFCDYCGDKLSEHDFAAKTATNNFLCSEATCTEAATYYYSCTLCGLSSRGTEKEATFSSGDALDHDWGNWIGNGDDTHSRVCSHDASHVETKDCSGGTATCHDKATCEICGKPYGKVDRDKHTGTLGDWQKDGGGHWKVYSCCPFSKAFEENHTYEWKTEGGKYWQVCEICWHETAKTDVPEITIQGAGKVCMTQDYTFTFTLPEGMRNTVAYFTCGTTRCPITLWVDGNGVYTGTILSTSFADAANEETNTLTIVLYSQTPDSYIAEATKQVEVALRHTGGEATCTDKAVCEICGDEYGEVDGENHTGGTELRGVSAATCTDDGYTGDTHCLSCGEKVKDGQIIPATGHTDIDKNHICDVEGCEASVGEHEAAEGKHTCDYCGRTVTECADEDGDHLCDTCGATLTAHTGGVATCTEKAVCEICGKEYGEFDPDDHSDLTHVEEKAATTESEGNIEYWYCGDCGRYFSDEACTEEITLADTVIAKLEPPAPPATEPPATEPPATEPPATDVPKTGDVADMALWLAVLVISGGALAGIAISGEKKKRYVK